MKKLMLMAFAVGAFTFASCSSDDDGGNSNCVLCSMDFDGTDVNTEYCDNGDGTITVTLKSQGAEVSQDQDLPEGTTFEEYVQAQEDAGANCN